MATFTQTAPYPTILAELVSRTVYRPNWQIELKDDLDRHQGSRGMTLIITTCGYNSYHPERGQTYCVNHFFPVPPAAYNERSWQRWLFEQFCLVERHEVAEFFQINDKRPYAPNHSPGNDPYIVYEQGTWEDADTSFLGVRNHADRE